MDIISKPSNQPIASSALNPNQTLSPSPLSGDDAFQSPVPTDSGPDAGTLPALQPGGAVPFGGGAANTMALQQMAFADAQQAQTIQMQIAADAQKQQVQRWKIIQDLQTKQFEIKQDVAVNKMKTGDKSANQFDAYIRA